jgi:low temperature requirement protein LtrA
MAIAFGFWWGYFHAGGATTPRAVRSRRDGIRLHIWSYAHLPLYVGLVVAFVGIQAVVAVAPEVGLDATQRTILAGSLAMAVGSLSLISAASTRTRPESHPQPITSGAAL